MFLFIRFICCVVVWSLSRAQCQCGVTCVLTLCAVQDTDMMPTRNWEKLCTCEIILISDNNIYTSSSVLLLNVGWISSDQCVHIVEWAVSRVNEEYWFCHCHCRLHQTLDTMTLKPDTSWHWHRWMSGGTNSLVLAFSLYCDFQLLHYFVLTKTT